ncbi:MAG: Dabb family protein [Candidatus Liptonbacteria bacterium]|nr:Dabb family protein [Candidatus Liptonbacteria bacterium]
MKKKKKIFYLLENLKKEIPEIREWSIGRQIKETGKDCDLAEVGSFDDPESLERFRKHPAHIKVRDMLTPIGSWTVVDYEY